MGVGVMRDQKIKLRDLHSSHAMGCEYQIYKGCQSQITVDLSQSLTEPVKIIYHEFTTKCDVLQNSRIQLYLQNRSMLFIMKWWNEN
jgi:hypothetical protein